MRNHFCSRFFTLAVLLSSAAAASAQTAASASIIGRVTDPQAAVVVGAAVTATNIATGIERTTKTTSDGLYRLPNLAPGSYKVAVEAPSFSRTVANEVHLNVGDTRDVDFRLELGSVSSIIEVTTRAPLIETTKTDVSTTVNEDDMARLPITTATGAAGGSGINDFVSLAVTAPGVRLDQTTVSNDLIGPGQFNDRNNLINIDGGNITDQVVSGR